jgi:hypothetical protein
MVDVDITRSILLGLANALPDQGDNLITRLDIRMGWGDAIAVHIHTGAPVQDDRTNVRGVLKRAIDQVMGDQRHIVVFDRDYLA